MVGEETYARADQPRTGGSATACWRTTPGQPLSGDDVAALQNQLLELGYDAAPADGRLRLTHRRRRCAPSSATTAWSPTASAARRRCGRCASSAAGSSAAARSCCARWSLSPPPGRTCSASGSSSIPDTAATDPGDRSTHGDRRGRPGLGPRHPARRPAARPRRHRRGSPAGRTTAVRTSSGPRSPTRSAPTWCSPCTSTASPRRTPTGWPRTTTAAASPLDDRRAVRRPGPARAGRPHRAARRAHTRKTWALLRLTRMPAVRVEIGYLTSPVDRPRLARPAVPRHRRRGPAGRRAAALPADRRRPADRRPAPVPRHLDAVIFATSPRPASLQPRPSSPQRGKVDHFSPPRVAATPPEQHPAGQTLHLARPATVRRHSGPDWPLLPAPRRYNTPPAAPSGAKSRPPRPATLRRHSGPTWPLLPAPRRYNPGPAAPSGAKLAGGA